MSFPLIALWVLVGWCGNEPRPIPIIGPGPDPDPDPKPYWITKFIGVVAGVLGGWGYTQVFGPQPEPWSHALPAAATAVGAFVVARFVTDLFGKLSGGGQNVTRG